MFLIIDTDPNFVFNKQEIILKILCNSNMIFLVFLLFLLKNEMSVIFSILMLSNEMSGHTENIFSMIFFVHLIVLSYEPGKV